jgi:uncharacterized membrane-anchored protein
VAFARAAELAPSPRIVLEWATAAVLAKDWESAKQAFGLLLQRSAGQVEFILPALVGLAKVAEQEGDREQFAHYAELARQLAPNNPAVLDMQRQLRAADPSPGPPGPP